VLFRHADGVDAEAVASGGVHVELGGDAGCGQGLIVEGSVFAVAFVVFGLDEEGRWGEFVGGVDGVERGHIGLDAEVGRVDDDGEAGSGVGYAGELDGAGGFGGETGDVGYGGGRFDVVVVRVGAEENGEVGSGGEADDADLGGIDMPLAGVGTGEAHGLLGVFEIGGVIGVVLFFRDAVFDEQAGDADGVEPIAGVSAFAVPGEADVASAGKDEGGGAGVFVRGGWVDGEGRVSDVGEASGAVAADESVGVFGDVGFGSGGLGGFGGSVGPEREDLLLGVGGEREEDEESGGWDAQCHG